MRKIIILLLVFLIYSCQKDKKAIALDIKSQIEATALEFEKDINVIINDFHENEIIEIEVLKPYDLTSEEFQEVFAEYLVYKMPILREFNDIKFVFYLDKEKNKNKTVISLNSDLRENIIKKYNKESYKEMIKYCLLEMKQEDPFVLELLQEIVNNKYPNDSSKNSFFDNIYFFSIKEGDKKNATLIEKEAKILGVPSFTIYNLYKLSSMAKEEKYIKASILLDNLWKLNYGKLIEESVHYDKEANSVYLL